MPLLLRSEFLTSTLRYTVFRAKRFRYLTTVSNFQAWRSLNNTMASSNKILLSPSDVGIFNTGSQSQDSASMASELLQKNHEVICRHLSITLIANLSQNHHILTNDIGFHNHIVHHLLNIYALGASPESLKHHFKKNAVYQRKTQPLKSNLVQEMSDYQKFKEYLGDERYYHDFLVFWQGELEKEGVEGVLQEWVFKGDEKADDMLIRLFGGKLFSQIDSTPVITGNKDTLITKGFFHPIIHLGFGLEFNQPAIIAEALAQACVHDDWMKRLVLPAEKAAAQTPSESLKTMPELLTAIRADQKLSSAAHWDDNNKIRDGILVRAPEEMLRYAAQWRVRPGELAEKTAEMMNACVYYTAAAQRPPKQVKFDFYLMHDVNASIFWSTFNALPYVSEAQKIRLLEWKARSDLAQYAARRSPELLLEEVVTYVPKDLEAGQAEWKGILRRLMEFDDDGHASKLGRAVANAQRESEPYEGRDWCVVKSWMWEKIGNMIVDSVEDSGATWVRSAGFDEAWKDYEDRPRQLHL